MIRFLLSLLVVFLLLVAFQDAPPVANILRSGPPGVAVFLRDTRDRILGQPQTPLIPPARPAGPAAEEFGRFFRQVEADARILWQTLVAHLDPSGQPKPPASPEKTAPSSPDH